ncbi:hypothetical protein ZIOFF_025541 [Zingiber officinale]|uniref:Uncharacterized protein n=1 Tax=Zingiber officinale TaxID=94328 RepID=A0A8J5H1M1_ZINOF|nr:hypothetical protein ZIOFF_025541 [Zingiber officinale]
MASRGSMDFSNNKISNEIPKKTTKLHGLCFLNLSNNHLIERIPENISVVTEVLVSMLATKAFVVKLIIHHLKQQMMKDGDKHETILDYDSIFMGFVVGFWACFGMTIIMKKSVRVALFQLDKICDWIYVQMTMKFLELKSKWQR